MPRTVSSPPTSRWGVTYNAAQYQHAYAAAAERYAYTASMTKQALDLYALQKQQLRAWMEDYDP